MLIERRLDFDLVGGPCLVLHEVEQIRVVRGGKSRFFVQLVQRQT